MPTFTLAFLEAGDIDSGKTSLTVATRLQKRFPLVETWGPLGKQKSRAATTPIEWFVCRIGVSQSRREIDARRAAKRTPERLPQPISPSRPRLMQAIGSLPIWLRSFVGIGSRCLGAVLKRERLNDSPEFINDLYAPVFPSLE